MAIAAKPISNLLVGFFVFVLIAFSVGCIKVSDLVNLIPMLFITSYSVTYVAFSRKRISSFFLSAVCAFCVLLLVYFSIQRISDSPGTAASRYLTYFLKIGRAHV